MQVSEAGNNCSITNAVVDNSDETRWHLSPDTQLVYDVR